MSRHFLTSIAVLLLTACSEAPEPVVSAPATAAVEPAAVAAPRTPVAPPQAGRRPLKQPLPAAIEIPVAFNRLIDNDMSSKQRISRQLLLEHFETDIDQLDRTWQQALIAQGFVRSHNQALGSGSRSSHYLRVADGIEISLSLSLGASSQGGTASGARGTQSIAISGPR